MRIKNFLNQRGFSLTELAIAGAIGAMLLLIGRQLLAEQAKQEALTKARADIAQAVSLLENTLRNKTTCKSMFFNQTLATNPSELTYVNARNETVSLIKDDTDYGSFKIETGGISLTDYPATQDQDMINLVINFKLKENTGGGVVQKRIPIMVSVNGSNQIQDCGSVLADANLVSEEKFCESLGAIATWNGTNCVLNAVSCPAGEIVESMDSLGVLNCVPALSKVDPANLFDTSPQDCTGKPNFKLITVDGKIKVECTAGGGGGSCNPTPVCPATYLGLAYSSQSNPAPTWTTLGLNPANTEEAVAGTDHCYLMLRKNTSCNSVDQVKQCYYSNPGLGCTPASCTPQPACPAAWGSTMTLANDNTTHGMSWYANTSLTEYLDIDNDGSQCRLSLRSNTSCTGVNEFRICEYNDSLNTGCAGSSYTSGGGECARPPCPNLGAGYTLILDTLYGASWATYGWNPALTEYRRPASGPASVNICLIDLRKTTSCQDGIRRCGYSSAGLGCP